MSKVTALRIFPALEIAYPAVAVLGRCRTAVSRNWTPNLVIQLNYLSNTTTRTLDFWLDSILGGYIIEFVVDCTQSYSVAKMDFFKGLRGRFLKALATWIKMWCDKCVMTMDSDF